MKSNDEPKGPVSADHPLVLEALGTTNVDRVRMLARQRKIPSFKDGKNYKFLIPLLREFVEEQARKNCKAA